MASCKPPSRWHDCGTTTGRPRRLVSHTPAGLRRSPPVGQLLPPFQQETPHTVRVALLQVGRHHQLDRGRRDLRGLHRCGKRRARRAARQAQCERDWQQPLPGSFPGHTSPPLAVGKLTVAALELCWPAQPSAAAPNASAGSERSGRCTASPGPARCPTLQGRQRRLQPRCGCRPCQCPMQVENSLWRRLVRPGRGFPLNLSQRRSSRHAPG